MAQNLEVLKNVFEYVRCNCFASYGVRVCSLTLHWSFSMSCMLSGLNYNPLQRSISYSVITNSAEDALSDVPSTVDSTSWSAPSEEYLLQNVT